QRRIHRIAGGVRTRDPLPLVDPARAGDAQRVVPGAGDADRVAELLVVQSEDLSGAGGRRDHGVSHVIVATIAHGCVPGEFALYLVARPHGFDELSTRGVDVFATGDQAPDVVARMWRLARCEKRVHEVEIAREARVVRRRTGRAGAPVRPPETGRIAAGSLFDRF